MAKNKRIVKKQNPPRAMTQGPAEQVAVQKFGRRFSTRNEFPTDLFKLELSTMFKYIGWKEVKDPTHYEQVEHVHFFFTVNSKGELNKYCVPVGEHFHACEVVMDSKTNQPITVPDPSDPKGPGLLQVKVGPPLKKVGVNTPKGKVEKIVRVFLWKDDEGQDVFDDHTHETTYIRTDSAKLNLLSTGNLAKAETIKALGSSAPAFPSGVGQAPNRNR